jgi:uncharacterized protein (TIGR03086 family)
MDAQQLFAKALEQGNCYMRLVRPEHLKNPTPCSEWDLHALLNHMVYELLWVPELIKGKTVAEVGSRFDGDVLRSDPKAAWQHAADAALVAVHNCKPDMMVNLSRGDAPATDYILDVGTDIIIHTWDTGQALNCSVILDEGVAGFIYENIYPHREELQQSGSYGPTVEVAADASMQDKLLGLSGRSPSWQAT